MRTVEVTDELQAYLDGLVPKRDQVLARMEEEAHRENIPIVDPHEGMLLYLLVKIAGAKRVLELGTATGYSGIWLLRGTDGGSLTTFEVDHKRAERARANFSDAGLGKQALVLEQDAVAGLEKVDQRFDACFIDLLNDAAGARAVPTAARRRRASDGRQRAAAGRGRATEKPAGAERRPLQRAGGEASAPGERRDPDP